MWPFSWAASARALRNRETRLELVCSSARRPREQIEALPADSNSLHPHSLLRYWPLEEKRSPTVPSRDQQFYFRTGPHKNDGAGHSLSNFRKQERSPDYGFSGSYLAAALWC
jgi:hypothetical protein